MMVDSSGPGELPSLPLKIKLTKKVNSESLMIKADLVDKLKLIRQYSDRGRDTVPYLPTD